MDTALFSRKGLSLDRLRVLVEVADAGGIARAVGDDTTRQSQYSRQLKELGQAFGIELTFRKGRSLGLTPEGLRLAALTRQAIAGFSDFAATVGSSPIVYRIGSGESLLQWAIVPILGELKNEFPNSVFSCKNKRTTDIVGLLQDCSLDYGLIRQNAVPSSLASKLIGTLEYKFYVPKKLLPPQLPKEKINLLTLLPIATLDHIGDYTKGIHTISHKLKKPLNISLICSTLPQVCKAVLSGNYAAILPTLSRQELPFETVIEIDIPALKSLKRPLALCWNPRLTTIREDSVRITEAFTISLKSLINVQPSQK